LDRDFRIPAPFCLPGRKLTSMSCHESAFEAKIAQMWKESDEKWARRMAELQRQPNRGSSVNSTWGDAATRTETDAPSPKVSPRLPSRKKGRPARAKHQKQLRHRRPAIFAGRRLNRRARPKHVVRSASTKWRPVAQHRKTSEPSLQPFWNLDVLHMFCLLCKLDKQLCPRVRRCGRTVPPSSRGGHWLLPQSVVLSWLRAIMIVIQVFLMHALLIVPIFW
jgi:hypothetical protein